MPEVERAQPGQAPDPFGDRLQPELADVQPLELVVGGLGEAPQASYSPSRLKIRRMIATEDAYVESMP